MNGVPAAVLSVLVQARGIQQTNAGLASVHGRLSATEGAAVRMGKQMARALKYGALAAAAGVAAAVKAAMDFDKEMRNVNSIAQLGERRFGQLQQKVLALAGPTAQAPRTLAAGLYDLVSSGFESKQALHILDKAARAATAGLTTTEVSTAAVAAVLNAYHLPAKKAGDVSDVLFRIVDRGVISFESLAQNVGDVLPFAASLNIDLREVGASIATMTKAGISAPETMTRIKAVMVTLLKPGKDLSNVIEELGYESGESMIKQLGFQGTLEALAKTTQGSKEELGKLFPNIRALGGALALTGANARGATDDLHGMQAAAGATARALSQQEKSTSFQLQRLRAQVEALAIGFGQKLLPEINEFIGVISDPKLAAEEKVSRVFELISDGAGTALRESAQAASKYGPRIIGALASGMAKAWTDMNPLGKLLTAGALVRVLGGKGAITAAGAAVGRWLGLGISAGAASTISAGGLAGGGAGGLVSTVAGGGIAGKTAGASAGAGLLGGMVGALKQVRWARVGGLGIGIALADQVLTEYSRRVDERSDDLMVKLKAESKSKSGLNFVRDNVLGPFIGSAFGDLDSIKRQRESAENLLAQLEQMRNRRVRISAATEDSLRHQAAELDLTKQQRAQLERVFNVIRTGRDLDVKVDLGMDPAKLRILQAGFATLRSGALSSLGDIGKVAQRNAQIIATQLPKGSQEARDKLAQTYRDAAVAIGKAMARGDISVKEGLRRQKELFRNANLISGDDPLGIAKGFAASWKKAGGINKGARRDMLADLAKMSPQAREKAYDLMVKYGQGLVRAKKIPQEDLRRFKSAALAQFTDLQGRGKASSFDLAIGIARNFGSMGGAVANVLEILRDNTNNALTKFGAKPLSFAVRAVGSLLGFGGGGKEQKKQSGGFIVPGTGTGDTFRTALPPGSFILNRKATAAAHGFQGGGLTPVALEPGERVFLPPEVRRHGQRNLEAANRAVPRFQKGGMHGKPQLSGPAGPLLDIGQGAVDRVSDAARAYVDRNRPKGFAGLGDAPAALKAAMALAQSKGLSITSTTGGGHVAGSWHYKGRAFDASNGVDTPQMRSYALAAAKRWGRNILELFYDPLGWYIKNGQKVAGAIGGHSDHVHTAMQRGGLLRAVQQMLADGGWVKTGYTTYSGSGPGAIGTLPKGDAYAELGTATKGGAATGTGYLAQALGRSGELPANFPLDVKIGSIGKVGTLYKRDRGYGQGTSAYGIDIHTSGFDNVGLTGHGKGTAWIRPADGKGGGLSEGQQKALEGKKRKANREQRLDALTREVREAQSLPAKQSKLWRLIKFWGRVGMFDKPERQHVLEAVRNAASQTKPQAAVRILSNLASYARSHGEITGQDPSGFRDMEKAIERAQDRGRELRKKAVEKQQKRVKAMRDRVAAKIAQRAQFPDWVARLTGMRRRADIGEEFASQLVTLEPENLTDAYVGQERGAYQANLDQLLGWRNTVVRAQDYATAEIGRFREQIAAIEGLKEKAEALAPVASAIALPNAKGGGKKSKQAKKLLGGWIEAFAKGGAEGKGKKQPAAAGGGPAKGAAPKQQPNRYAATLAAYNKQKFKLPLLEQAIKDAQAMRDETWASELEEIQGLSGPKGILESLSPEPTPGAIGGRIFEVQNSIRELALKLNNATASGSDASEQLALVQEQLRQESQRRIASDAHRMVLAGWDRERQGIMSNFAGMFAAGGFIPRGMWGIAGEQGPEPVMGPATVMSNREGREVFGGGGTTVQVVVNGTITQEPGDKRPAIEVRDEQGDVIERVFAAQGTGRQHPSAFRTR